jgi:hypothetical protein
MIFFQGSIRLLSFLIWLITFSAASWSSQKPGASVSFSLSAIAFSIAAESKTPPNVHDFFSQLFYW